MPYPNSVMSSVTRVKAADTQGAIDALERDGAVILSDFTTIEDVENVNLDVSNHWHNADKVNLKVLYEHTGKQSHC